MSWKDNRPKIGISNRNIERGHELDKSAFTRRKDCRLTSIATFRVGATIRGLLEGFLAKIAH